VTGCHHYGAAPFTRCYCGALVSRQDWARAQRERDTIRYELGSRWHIVRDEAGLPRRMEWAS
jgi:hypothetical protein